MAKIKSNGTALFGIVGGTRVVRFRCFRGVELGQDTVGKIDISCLDDDTKKYMAGSIDPAEGSLTVQLDDANTTHAELLKLAESSEDIQWYLRAPVSEEDTATIIPAVTGSGNEITLPTTVTWAAFTGYLTSVGPTVEIDDVWTYAFPLVRTSKISTIVKAAS